jgi:pyroglutamyl-peptidase
MATPPFDPSKLRIVATGFGPFLDHQRNPSWEVARAFSQAVASHFPTDCERLAVTYAEAQHFVERVGYEEGHLLVVHFGLSGRRDHVALERFAHNCRGETRDETGRDGWPDHVEPGGPLALQTLLPLRSLAAELDARLHEALDLRARVSRDAGEYVCNAIYYRSLLAVERVRGESLPAEALFVHVPQLEPARADALGAHLGELFCAHLSDPQG